VLLIFVNLPAHVVHSSALDAAVTALNAATQAMTAIGEHNDDITSSDAAKAFDAAEEKIAQYFTTFNVSLSLRMRPSVLIP
jgi:phage shock protein A